MKALWYNAVGLSGISVSKIYFNHTQPRDFVIKDVPIPQIKDDEVLLKGQLNCQPKFILQETRSSASLLSSS